MHLPRTLLKLTAPLAAAGALAAPGAADAAVTCQKDANFNVNVTMSASGDQATISRSGSDVTVTGCTSSAAATLGSIKVTDTSNGGTTLNLGVGATGLSNGIPEQGGLSEIEIEADLGGGSDLVNFMGSADAEDWDAGALAAGGWGVNFNGDGDADLVTKNADAGYFNLGNGDDELLLHGPAAAGFSGPLPVPTNVYGGIGADVVGGGEAKDWIDGGDGDDTLKGGGGANTIDPGAGDDKAVGGPGHDVLMYMTAPGGLTIDLAKVVAQDTLSSGTDQLGGFEQVFGTKHADHLSGTNGNEELNSGAGADWLEPRGGNDIVRGGDDSDMVDYGDAPAGVSVSLLDGEVSGGGGSDTLFDIENATGSKFDDVLEGGPTFNILNPGDGEDFVRGLGGDDAVHSRDGAKDTVQCGDGDKDEVVADHAGLDTLDTCEKVDRSAAPQSASSAGTADGGAKPAAVTPQKPAAVAPPVLPVVRSATPAAPARVALTAKAKQRAGKQLRATVACDRACAVVVRARVKLGGRTIVLPARRGAAGRIVITVPKAAQRSIRTALRRGAKPTVQLSVDGAAAAATVKLVK